MTRLDLGNDHFKNCRQSELVSWRVREHTSHRLSATKTWFGNCHFNQNAIDITSGDTTTTEDKDDDDDDDDDDDHYRRCVSALDH